jgi:hypothetical protein
MTKPPKPARELENPDKPLKKGLRDLLEHHLDLQKS